MPFPVDIEAIHAAEEKLSIRFPTDFVAGMQSLNGGEIQALDDIWYLHPFFDRSDRKRLSRTCNDIVRMTLKCREMEWFPQSAVSIADSNGDALLLLPDDNDSSLLGDDVFVWYMCSGNVEPLFNSTAAMFEKRV